MEGLNLDVTTIIFSKLDMATIATATCVCREWRNVGSSHSVWAKWLTKLERHNYSPVSLTSLHVKKLNALIQTKNNPFSAISSSSMEKLRVWANHEQQHLHTTSVVVKKLWIALLMGAHRIFADKLCGRATYDGFSWELCNVSPTEYARFSLIVSPNFARLPPTTVVTVTWRSIIERMTKLWQQITNVDDTFQCGSKPVLFDKRVHRTDKWPEQDNQRWLVCGQTCDPNLQQPSGPNWDGIRNEA